MKKDMSSSRTQFENVDLFLESRHLQWSFCLLSMEGSLWIKVLQSLLAVPAPMTAYDRWSNIFRVMSCLVKINVDPTIRHYRWHDSWNHPTETSTTAIRHERCRVPYEQDDSDSDGIGMQCSPLSVKRSGGGSRRWARKGSSGRSPTVPWVRGQSC